MLDEPQVRQFARDGWLHLPGVLDPKGELAALGEAYQFLVGTLARQYYAELGVTPPSDFEQRSIGSRFALMQGASGGHGAEHLDPYLGLLMPGYRRGRELASTQIPELFHLMRAAPLLDAIEGLLGPEIELTPRYHLNFKLPQRDLDLEGETARTLGREDPAGRILHGFFVGQTSLHCDAPFGAADAHESGVVTAWIPMSPAGGEVGSLVVLPGSHRLPRGARPADDAKEVEVVAKPGDVVLFDSWTFHRSTPNNSNADVRWAFNFRYVRRGSPSGRPYLPPALVRSRSEPQQELKDGSVWQAIWQRALDHLERPTLPLPLRQATSLEEARAITEAWNRRLPDIDAWLGLEPAPRPSGWGRVRPALGRWKRAALARLGSA